MDGSSGWHWASVKELWLGIKLELMMERWKAMELKMLMERLKICTIYQQDEKFLSPKIAISLIVII